MTEATSKNNATQSGVPTKSETTQNGFNSGDALEALTFYGKGVVSGLSLKDPIQLYKKHSEIRRLITKCVVYNGGILLSCIVLFELCILPFVNKCFPPQSSPWRW